MNDQRPMRLAKREVTDEAQLRAVVERARVVHLGMADAEGVFVVPMNYGFDWPEGAPAPTLWLHSAPAGRKVEVWRANPQAAVEIEVESGLITGDFSCANSFAYESVMAQGRIAEALEEVDKLHGLERIMEHVAPGAPARFAPEALARVAVWRVELAHLTGKRRIG